MIRCVFFDRDGIVNASPGAGYVERWEDFRFLPAFADVLDLVVRRGYAGVIATNQRGVARGLVSAAEVERIHRNLRRLLERDYGLRLLDVLYCPHEDGECSCRKPQPGLLLEAARRHSIDLAGSWMVGDNERDVEAGRRAGCRTVLVEPGSVQTAADHRVGDLKGLESLFERVLTYVKGA